MNDLDNLIEYSVVICTWNRCEFLSRALSGLQLQTFSQNRFEIIVIDNASPDRTREVVEGLKRSIPNLFYFLELQQGTSYARNRGLKEARGKVVCFLDDDAIPAPDWLVSIHEVFNDFANTGIVGGRCIPMWGSRRPKWLANSLLFAISAVDCGTNVEIQQNGIALIAANIAYLKGPLLEIGGFPTSLGRKKTGVDAGEETFITNLLISKGFSAVYCGKAVVHHHIHENRLNFAWFCKRFFVEGFTDIELSHLKGELDYLFWLGRIGFATVRAVLNFFKKLLFSGDPRNAFEPAFVIVRQAGRLKGIYKRLSRRRN